MENKNCRVLRLSESFYPKPRNDFKQFLLHLDRVSYISTNYFSDT